jgi:hypothetical protein
LLPVVPDDLGLLWSGSDLRDSTVGGSTIKDRAATFGSLTRLAKYFPRIVGDRLKDVPQYESAVPRSLGQRYWRPAQINDLDAIRFPNGVGGATGTVGAHERYQEQFHETAPAAAVEPSSKYLVRPADAILPPGHLRPGRFPADPPKSSLTCKELDNLPSST